MSKFDPKFPNYEQRVKESFAAQGAMSTIGASLVSVSPGAAVIELPFDRKLSQQHGFIHAGIITTCLDSAAGYAAFSLMPENAEVLTIELKTSLMSPARGERFRFEGRVIKAGRTITFGEADAFAINLDGTETKIASMTATMMSVIDRSDVKAG